MRKNNLEAWTYTSSLNCLLFFAQRMDELLFHHTTDSYRYSALSIRGLASEYCMVYRDVNSGTINKKNLDHIIEEFVYRLKSDDVAKEILSKEYVERFEKNYGSWDSKRQFENMQYVARKLGNRVYYNCVVKRLKELIEENKQKKEIDKKTALFVREVLDCGYNENYVYQMLHNVFFHEPVSSIESLETFFSKFDFQEKRYDVYIGYTSDMSSLMPIFEKLVISDLNVSMIDMKKVPVGIKTKRQKTILKFEAIESYDRYSAFEIADSISSCVVNAYSFFRHDPATIRSYGQVMDENGEILTIQSKKMLKNRVAALSQENATQKADLLIKMQFANYDNLNNFMKITSVHNSAICSNNISDSLLSLWSIMESIVEEDVNIRDSKDKEDNNNENKKERSKIGNIISYTIPYLKSSYITKLVQTCMTDIIRWDKDFFDSHIANNNFGNNDLECTFAFLAFNSTQAERDELYSKTETFPLLRYRVCTLSEQLHNSKGIKNILNIHTQRVKWHLYRIYRARNYIIHDANENEKLNQELVINLHSYVDTLFEEVIEYINKSPYNDSISVALSGHKLAISIMDEMLETQINVDINEKNAWRYLYYDFER